MKRILRKLFKPKPKYEPVGIIQHGWFEITIGDTYYEAFSQGDGTINVWANEEYIGNYPKDRALLEIIEHAKENK